MGWGPGGDKERLAQELLDQNAAIIFKLSGLAQLRRRSGANLPPSAEEEALLAEAQHCLQSVALLLPPKALMKPTAAKRLRQHLLEPPELEAATAPAAAEEGGGGKRQQLEAQPSQPERQQQQVEQAQQLHLHQQLQQLQHQHPALAAQLQRTQSFGGAPTYSGGSAGARAGPFAGAGSLQPPSSSLLGGLQPAPSTSQGSLLGLALGSGRLPAADAAAAMAAVPAAAGGPARSGSSGLQLGQLSLGLGQQQQAAASLRQQPSMPLAAALQEPTAKEDLWLLSQAYGSMTAEQKEKLAAQPPEVRQFIIHERMRKTREQLELLQRHAAAQAAGQAARERGGADWGGLAGAQQALPAQQQQQQLDWPAAGPQFAQQARLQQQQSLGSVGPSQLDLPTPQDSMRLPSLSGGLPSFSGGLPRMSTPPAFPPLQPPQQQAPLFPQQQDLQQQQAGALGAAGAASAGGAGSAAPFVAMSEADRLEHLRRLKRRQEEWLEQQRRAAAMLSEGGAAG